MAFWRGFTKYVGVQGVLALLLTCAVIGLLAAAREIPSEIYGLLGVSWGFYFAKNGSNVVNAVKK